MNVITLNNEQLAHVRSTLQKQANSLVGDMNAAGQSNWSELLTDLANDQHDLIRSIIAELDDCQTFKVIAPTPQEIRQQIAEATERQWLESKPAAKALKVDSKKLHNLKQTGRLCAGDHFRKEGRNIRWNVPASRLLLSENSH